MVTVNRHLLCCAAALILSSIRPTAAAQVLYCELSHGLSLHQAFHSAVQTSH
jgi:hypothetical protein